MVSSLTRGRHVKQAVDARTVDPDELLDLATASQVLRVAPNTLLRRDWRDRYQVPVVRVGGRVFYRRGDLLEWLRQR